MGRNDLCFCGSGQKIKKCHPDINELSVIASLLRKYSEVDNIIKGERASYDIPCSMGCTDCCYDYFYISQVEYICIAHFVIAHGLNQTEICERAMAVTSEIFDNYPLEHEKLQQGKGLSLFKMYDDSRIAHLSHCCPFLDAYGNCLIYPVRPFICRGHGCLLQFGGCQKCQEHHLSPRELPEDIMVQNVDSFKVRDAPTLVPKPYPLAEWISYFGFAISAQYTAALYEPIEHYKKSLLAKENTI